MEAEVPDAELLPPEEEPPPPLPLSAASPEELRGFPGLARLLQGLGRALGPDGLSAALERELRQAEAGLALWRGAWLRWESLWRGLQELRRHPGALPPPVSRALEQALTRAELPLPPDPSPLGSRLLPALERHLGEKNRELGNYLAGEGEEEEDGGPSPHPLDPSPALAAHARRLHHARRRRHNLRRLLEEQRCAYPQVLGRCAALLGRLAGEGCAGAWAELDGRRARYLEAKAGAVLLKIRLEELGVLLDTYPSPTVEAHRRLRAGLEAALERAAGEAAGARAALGALEALGRPLQELAGEYGRLREGVGQRRWALRQLRPSPPP